MKYWIIPANPQIYKLENALRGLNGVIDWRQHNNFEIGDIVYILLVSDKSFSYQ